MNIFSNKHYQNKNDRLDSVLAASKLKVLSSESVVMGINTTTSALLYKHAFMATWLEWWTVVAS